MGAGRERTERRPEAPGRDRPRLAVGGVVLVAALPVLVAALVLWWLRPDPAIGWAVLALSLIAGPGGAAWIGTRVVGGMRERLLEQKRVLAENVASLEESNRALSVARAELVQAEKMASVGRLASGVAHEVGNPLSAILTYLDLAERRGTDPDLIEDVREEARRIDRIVSGLLDFARPTQEKTRRVEPGAFVEETVELLRHQGHLQDIGVELVVEEQVPAVEVDPDRLRQVLLNLLLNARDALAETPARTSQIEVSVAATRHEGFERAEFRKRRSDDPEEVDYRHLRRSRASSETILPPPLVEGQLVVRFEVADRGPGLPEELEGRVFDPFFTTKAPGEGTGLGLSVASRLVERMGGTIRGTNRPGGGALFAVDLPAGGEERA